MSVEGKLRWKAI